MFNWLGNLFPYSDLHSLNLDWILTKMKETAAQAAQAIADSAKALAQVIEAKTAAQNAQTAAQNAQTAAQNAQTAADNAANSAENAVSVAQDAKNTAQTAQSAAQTAQNTANAAQSAAQTAQNTANTAQSAAQTAQNTANTAQSAAQTAQTAAQTAQSAAENAQSGVDRANEKINTLNGRFPIKNADIANNAVTTPKLASQCVTLEKLNTTNSYLYRYTVEGNIGKFPRSGSATLDQIMSGVVDTQKNTLSNLNTEYLQVSMDITEANQHTPNTVFRCVSPVVNYINKLNAGLVAIAPIIVIKEDTNDTYNGFIRLIRENVDSLNSRMECKVIFNTTPPFNADTKFVITANPVTASLRSHV